LLVSWIARSARDRFAESADRDTALAGWFRVGVRGDGSTEGVHEAHRADVFRGVAPGDTRAVALRVMKRTSLVVALLTAAIAPAGASAAPIHVTTTAPSGLGSLRQAITDAQAAGPDEIVFDAGVTGTITLGPMQQLPMLSAATTVTAPRTNGVPDVELHCTDPSVGTGLQTGAGETGVVVTGVSITNCTNGIFVPADGGLTLRGSWIGRSRTGSTGGNTVNGFGALAGARIVVGGPSADDGNLIVGNGGGVGAVDPAAGAVVQGNTISDSGARGVNLTNADGVVVQDNVVSGNAASGIALLRGEGAVIRGNRVGTDAAGATAQPNGFAGINLLGTVGATIGGTGGVACLIP
jgi:parallel beta-helix repeat protein